MYEILNLHTVGCNGFIRANRISRLSQLALTALLVTACKPGAVGSKGKDGIKTTQTIPELSGLSGDADVNYRLFYVSGVEASPGLYAYTPGSADVELIDANLSLNKATDTLGHFPVAIRTGTVVDGRVEDFQVAGVLYYANANEDLGGGTTLSLPSTIHRASVDGGAPVQITSVDWHGNNGALGRFMISFDLTDALNSRYVYAPGTDFDAWGHVRLGDDSSTPVQTFSSDLVPSFPVHDAATSEPTGWLVLDKSQGNCLARAGQDALDHATCIPNTDGSGNVIVPSDDNGRSSLTSGYSLGDGQVIAVAQEAEEDSLSTISELWFYRSGEPGTLTRIENSEGEPLYTKSSIIMGGNDLSTVIGRPNGDLYMASGDGGVFDLLSSSSGGALDMEFHTYLTKITTTDGAVGWEHVYHQGGTITSQDAARFGGFLVDAGDRLIWSVNDQLKTISLDGKTEVVLDGRENDGSSLIAGAYGTPIPGVSEAGWFFYNRENDGEFYATAAQSDGSKRIEMAGCTWIGASTSGTAPAMGGAVGTLAPSEVFMHCDQHTIAALDANDPAAGRVILGTLEGNVDSVAMGFPAPGPHRLMRVIYEDDDATRIEVVYVNTRESNSLKHLMAEPANDDVDSYAVVTGPVSGF